MTRRRGAGQKAALLFARLGFLVAVAAAVGAAVRAATDGTADPIFASLLASVVFFGGAGIVLHVIGRADLPDLRIGRDSA